MKKLLFCIALITSIITLTGCENPKDTLEAIAESKESTDKEETKDTCCYYTGVNSEEKNTDVPFMAIVENSSAARPQSGLSSADIIYETSAEAGIPRFIALFQSESPSSIGPVRSVRPYFLSIANEYNLPFAHCGGSSDALDTISSSNNKNSINELANGSYFWRDNKRKAPHNLYTSSDNIRKYISDNKLETTDLKNTYFSFDDNYFENKDLKDAENLKITINKSYNTSYIYKDNCYYKSMDGKEAVDAANSSVLNFSNVIIQKTKITLNSDKIHLDIDLTGEGEGYLLSKGKVMDIKWKKDDDNSKTKLYDSDGNEVSLSPGKTIWHIVDNATSIEMN